MLNVAFDPTETRVKRFLVWDCLNPNTREVIYALLLTRRWFMDSVGAGKSSTMQWSHRITRETLGWMQEAKWERSLDPVWTTELKKKDDILPYLSIGCKLCHLFTIYFIYFGDAWPELINICCLVELGLIGTRWRLFEVSVAPPLKLGGWKHSIQIWLEDNLEMNFGLPLKATDRRQTCY